MVFVSAKSRTAGMAIYLIIRLLSATQKKAIFADIKAALICQECFLERRIFNF